MGVFGLSWLGRGRTERAGYELYGAAVAAARHPYYYAELGVPDTLDGRFDLVGLHAFLLIRRLTAEPKRQARGGPELAQAIFDAMFHDMDVNLREMGAGDLSVGKKLRVMWEAFHGRSIAYDKALKEGPVELAAALSRNLWPELPESASATRIAQIAMAQDNYLARCSIAQIRAGEFSFLAPEQAAS